MTPNWGRDALAELAHRAAEIGYTYGALGRDFTFAYKNVEDMLANERGVYLPDGLDALVAAVEALPRYAVRYDPRSGTDRLFEDSDGHALMRAEVLRLIREAAR